MCNNLLLVFVSLLVIQQELSLSSSNVFASINTSMELCGAQSEIDLTKSGDSTTRTVSLTPGNHQKVCKIRVKAPKGYAINMQFVESLRASKKINAYPPCVLSIFLPENPKIPVWKGDPCSDEPLKHDDLLTSDFKIVWIPPADPSYTRGRKFVLTAVGQGQVCKEPGQHTCMRIGWDPIMCVADSLLCDGFVNCPKSSTTTDEDDKLCKRRFFAPASLEQLAVELFKKWKPPELENNTENNALDEGKRQFFNWKDLQEAISTQTTTTSTTPKPSKKPPKATDSISQVLSKYGPWGYLMLGMLICGTVLMFCGLWECCFRKPKNDVDPPLSPAPPTTVLIINPQQEESATPNPPNYDELDLPPSYTTLFPNLKRNSESDSNSAGQSTNSCEESVDET